MWFFLYRIEHGRPWCVGQVKTAKEARESGCDLYILVGQTFKGF